MAVLPHLCRVPAPTMAAPGKYCTAALSPLAHPQGTQEQQHCRAGGDSGSRPAAKLCCTVHACSECWTKAALEIRTNVPYSVSAWMWLWHCVHGSMDGTQVCRVWGLEWVKAPTLCISNVSQKAKLSDLADSEC